MNTATKAFFAFLSIVSIAALVVGIIAIVQVNKKSDEEAKEVTTTEVPPAIGQDFASDFEFGAATSAYQIEGAWNVDGKGRNIWDMAVHDHPEIIRDNATGDSAAESYNNYKEDVKALKASGFNFYRFSISWSRILPLGMQPNELGIEYYNNLINELIANGIKPLVTMYHWDLPEYVQQVGGWANSISVDYFEQYSNLIYERFGDRVKTFITFNEPYIFCERGYGSANQPPLVKQPGFGEYLCGRNVLLAHARAYHNYNAKYRATQLGRVGICLFSDYYYPQDNSTAAANLANQAINHMLGWFAHPIYSKDGNYPQVMIDNIKRNSGSRPWSRLAEFTTEEIELIKGSADFLALNYYSSRIVKPKVTYPEEYDWEADAGVDRYVNPQWERAESSWLYVVPEGLRDLLIWIKNNYDNPTVIIAENGYSDTGEIEDDKRISYIRKHLQAVKDAMDQGCNVAAYTVWSLIDNFEWLEGFHERFGIYYIDFLTKRRIPKKSSKYFKELITSRMI
ncbi:myrosinase 1-like [Chironomus tepperi]|uniref:myrosinase 1-like n=1 Tax=Chironomus tepperi TaxID=113505 RepID=UPI00391F753A